MVRNFKNHTGVKPAASEYDPAEFKVTVARQKLVSVFTANLLPFALVDNAEFRDFVSYISSNRFEQMPHRSLVTTLIDNVAKELQLTVKDEMAKALFINLTMDACKLNQMKQSMVTITAHWIEDWKMRSVVLCVSLAFGICLSFFCEF